MLDPFGFPVEPEVYKIKEGSSASITSIGQLALTLFISKSHHKSRSIFIEILLFVRFNTIHFLMDGVVFIASSAIFFREIILSALKPPSAVIKRLHFASFIHNGYDFAEKPAKTTECIAPILARMTAIANSGTIGI